MQYRSSKSKLKLLMIDSQLDAFLVDVLQKVLIEYRSELARTLNQKG